MFPDETAAFGWPLTENVVYQLDIAPAEKK